MNTYLYKVKFTYKIKYGGVQIGRMDGTNDFVLLLHQGAYNQSLLITIQANKGRIVRMRMSEYEV